MRGHLRKRRCLLRKRRCLLRERRCHNCKHKRHNCKRKYHKCKINCHRRRPKCHPARAKSRPARTKCPLAQPKCYFARRGGSLRLAWGIERPSLPNMPTLTKSRQFPAFFLGKQPSRSVYFPCSCRPCKSLVIKPILK